MMEFQGKVAVVTGAASGIGRATARELARRGCRVHLVDIAREPLELATAELRGEGLAATAHVVDCSKAEAVAALAAEVFASEGRVDILHNNAGVGQGGTVETLGLDDWRWIVDINLWSVIHGIHAFLPRMLEAGAGGHIVNTASGLGLYAISNAAAYCTTKFAVVGLSEALAIELAPKGIRVTTVCPGIVNTNIIRASRIHETNIASRDELEVFYRQYGASPEQVAADIVAAIEDGSSLVLTPRNTWIPWLVKRFSTSLYRRLVGWIDRRMRGRLPPR